MVEAVIAALLVLAAALVLTWRVRQALRCSVGESTAGCSGCGQRGSCTAAMVPHPDPQHSPEDQPKIS